MRKQNSEFKTAFTSEADNDLKNTDYFGFVELDDFACYVIADGIDDQTDAISAKLAVAAAVSAFTESPSMSKRTMASCLKAANHALLTAKSKMKLKASILVILTNYAKMRYGQAGNIRLRLYRDGFLKLQSTDQSLTLDMVKEERVTLDKVAEHEERNNLYAYLGQEKEFHPFISKKIKLSSSDAISLYTRGIWEHIDETELKDVFAEATDDPEKTVGEVEELLLSRQPQDLNKYTFAVLFINKIFLDPNRKRKIKRMIMIAIPIVILAATLTVILVIRHNIKMDHIDKMEQGYTNTIEYIQANNYIRAEEECKTAQKEADQIKDKKMQSELGDYMKLIEAVIKADKLLDDKKYEDAQNAYKEGEIRSRYVDNLGLDYIKGRLSLTANYISVYDLINLGDSLAQNLQYDKSEEKYLQAKTLAGKIYFDEGRKAAIDALDKLYADQKSEKEADNEQAKQQTQLQDGGANYVAKGDEAYAQGDYNSAKVYYTSAQQTFTQLGDDVQKAAVNSKLQSTENKIAAQAEQLQEAEGYMSQAADSQESKDYNSAKKYYLLAKDIYASLKMDDKVNEVERKMEVLDIKTSESQVAESAAQKSASDGAAQGATAGSNAQEGAAIANAPAPSQNANEAADTKNPTAKVSSEAKGPGV